jgi:hypothetical protein
MRKGPSFFALSMLVWPGFSAADIEMFTKKYSGPIYQDILIGTEIHAIGSDHCEPRYQLIRPVLDRFDRPFSVLDLGAAQGYFSFKIASDYPQSSCVMVESNHTSYYALHGDMLGDLCTLNSHLTNVAYLNKRMGVSDLAFLNQREHFDVIIAFLVVHLMDNTLNEQNKILEELLKLGDNLIIEVANDVGVLHTTYVEYLANRLGAEYLGEVKRHKDPESTSTGKMFWFKSKTPQATFTPLHAETFQHLNGVHPAQF